ncbi:MAG: FN3 associated domain-containing protein [bacterium]|nr:FN3 associated domain-containing protein [bacterium]
MKDKFKLLLLCLLTIVILQFSGKTTYANEEQSLKTGLHKATLTMTSEAESSNLFHATRSSYYSSEWEKYSSYYYYNTMNANEKKLYDQLNKMCLYYLESPSNLTDKTNNKTTTPYVTYSGLKAQDAYNVALIFYYSNPQYFYLQPGFCLYYSTKWSVDQLNGRVAIYVYDDFKNGTKRVSATEKFKQEISTYVKQLEKQPTLQDKVKKAHDLVTGMTVYKSTALDQSAYSTFIEHKTVCAGYAAAFSILCNAIDIDTTVVTSETHAWNNIRLNGSWYNIDCTWDDLDGAYGMSHMYLYFNRSKTILYQYDKDSAHVPTSSWNNYLPSCTLDSGATIDSCGKISTPGTKTATPVIATTTGNGKNTIKITSNTPGSTIYYTLNGSAPSAANAKCYRYTGAFTITKSCTIKAIAVHNTYSDSATATSSQKVAISSAVTPSITSQPASNTYSYGDKVKTLSIKASVTDGGTLSYQWYKNIKNKATGGTVIENATKSSYVPSLSNLGTTYYYCVVTNTNTKATVKKSVAKTSVATKITVKAKSLKACKVSGIKTKTYTGKTLKQSILVKNGSITLKEKTDYKVSYKKNKNIGTATVTITGINHYTGSCSYSFTITPKKNNIKVSSGSRTLKISCNKDSNASGYVLQYTTNKKFSHYFRVTLTKNSTTKISIKHLKSKQTYYVRLRSYKKVGSKTIYGPWSKVVSCKVK